MNKLLLFSVTFIRLIDYLDVDYCVLCGRIAGKLNLDLNTVMFKYYDYNNENINEHSFFTCNKCFDNRIRNIPLAKLRSFVPLLKMMNKPILHRFFPCAPIQLKESIGIKDYKSNPIVYYKLTISKEELRKYYQKARVLVV